MSRCRASARRLERRLNELGIGHRYEEFPNNHTGVDYRMDESLRFLRKRCPADAEFSAVACASPSRKAGTGHRGGKVEKIPTVTEMGRRPYAPASRWN